MITTFEDFNQDPAILNIDNEQESIIQEYLQSFRPKICCLESYWEIGMTDVFSIKVRHEREAANGAHHLKLSA